jgi:hypothetical protein
MQSTILALGAFAGLAAAWGNSSYGVYTTTEVVSSYTTVCPGPTSVVEGNVTYTATSATTLTITNCPCTRTHVTTGVPPAPYTTVVTDVVTDYTTTCPAETTFTTNSVTYTATESEVITVTACPCTQTKTTVLTPGVAATSTAVTYETTVVESYTTVCPTSTVIVVPGPSETVTYTATPSQTVTVTNGPFTTSTPKVYTTTFIPAAPAPAVSTAAAAPGVASASIAPPAPTAAPSPFTGGAQKVASGLGFGGVLGLLAYIL